MIQDIVGIPDGTDLQLARSDVAKAANVLSVQLGELEYAPNFGVDHKYFLDAEVAFQNESYRAYLVQRLVEHQVNIMQCVSTLSAFMETITYQVGEPFENGKGLVI